MDNQSLPFLCMSLITKRWLANSIVILFALAFQFFPVSGQQIDSSTLEVTKRCLGATTSTGDKSDLQVCSEAATRLRPYAESGDAAAQASLGLALALGLNAPKEGAIWLYRSAVQGNPGAQLQLAALQNEGIGVPRDRREAYAWALLAANELNGNAAALRDKIQADLTEQEIFQGLVLARERDLVATDASEISEIPSEESAPVQECIAAAMVTGEFSPKTAEACETAMRWYFPDAEEGDATSQAFLGIALVGMGKTAEGAQWVHQAALKGVPKAQYVLALLLRHGVGLSKDLLAAQRWAEVAGPLGEEIHDEIMAELNKEFIVRSLDGVYIGLWESTRFLASGTCRMVIATTDGEPRIEVFVTGGKFKGGKVELISLEHVAGGLWKVEFKAKSLEVSGTFHGKKFVGSYKYRRRLKRDDIGQWLLFKE